MYYPIIPFSSSWELPVKTTATVNASKFGESGLDQRETLSINPLEKTIQYNVTLSTANKVNLMVTFLDTNIGKAIRIPYSDTLGTSGDDGFLYRYKEYTQTFSSSEASSFSFELSQVRRLE